MRRVIKVIYGDDLAVGTLDTTGIAEIPCGATVANRHDIAVFDDVLFPFKTQQAFFFQGL